jgi:Na+-transporting NADH:ubiquinone oxidoreductase subunit C
VTDKVYTLVYAATVGTVCALLLAGAGRFTRPYREANEEAEKVSNILRVLGVPFEDGASAEELVGVFKRTIREQDRGGLSIYVYSDSTSGQPVAIAVPFAGPGLWGPVEGFLALEPDMRTIRGITFHKHEETPGLGGEIGAPWFRGQFKGKSILSASGKPGLRVRRGKGATAANEVDGITGATMTCTKVEAMLNAVVAKIVKEGGTDGE